MYIIKVKLPCLRRLAHVPIMEAAGNIIYPTLYTI